MDGFHVCMCMQMSPAGLVASYTVSPNNTEKAEVSQLVILGECR